MKKEIDMPDDQGQILCVGFGMSETLFLLLKNLKQKSGKVI